MEALQQVENIQQLRLLIHNKISEKVNYKSHQLKSVSFVKDDILIKPIDYYYTNPIARASKVMSDCRKISKKFLFTGIEKAS